jgi:hypothetical protein
MMFNPHGVNVGDVWVENDPRHYRRIKVLELIEDGDSCGYAMIKNMDKNTHPTRAKLSRFSGSRSGYILEKSAEAK